MGLAGKIVKIFFRDGEQVRCRTGKVIEEGISFLIFQTDFGTESFANANIVRIEVLGESAK